MNSLELNYANACRETGKLEIARAFGEQVSDAAIQDAIAAEDAAWAAIQQAQAEVAA